MSKTMTASLAFLFAACLSSGYSVVLTNSSASSIDDAQVSYSGFESLGGFIPSGIAKYHRDIREPIPARVLVTWTDAKKRIHNVEVEIPKNARRRFSGDLVFTVNANETVSLVVRR